MTPEDIIAMAKEADELAEQKETDKDWVFDFANLIRNATLEEAALVAERAGFGQKIAFEIREMKHE